MPITLQCDCGKKFKVVDDLAGKRVKCPECKEIVNVPGGIQAREPPPDDEDEGEDYDDRPARVKKKKKKRAKSGSKLGLWIAVAAGVVVLGFCCIGMGVGGYILLGAKSAERTLVGRWQVDAQAQQKNDPNPLINDATAKNTTMEFESNGTLRATDVGMTFTRQWKQVKTDGKVITIEISGGGIPNTVIATVTIIDNDHIRYQAPTLFGHSLYLKRIS
jgi:hypothetical protein